MLRKILVILIILLISHSYLYYRGYNNGSNNKLKEIQKSLNKTEEKKTKEFEKLYKEMLEKKDEVDKNCSDFLNQPIPSNCLLIHRN